MSEHTPGPWSVAGETIDNYYPIYRHDTMLGLVFSWADSGKHNEGEAAANANLVAAAPDLLASIERLRDLMKDEKIFRMQAYGIGGEIVMGDAMQAVDDAIAKARGEQPATEVGR